MSQPIFYVGQKVGCLMYGEGVVDRIQDNFGFPIVVKFENTQGAFTADGRYSKIHARPMLYPVEQYRAIIATLPAPEPEKWQPKMGEWCWFWDDGAENYIFSKFGGMVGGKKFLSIRGIDWDNCAPFIGELPPHLKEGQP